MNSNTVKNKLIDTIESCTNSEHVEICTNWFGRMSPKMDMKDGAIVYETLYFKRKEILLDKELDEHL